MIEIPFEDLLRDKKNSKERFEDRSEYLKNIRAVVEIIIVRSFVRVRKRNQRYSNLRFKIYHPDIVFHTKIRLRSFRDKSS